MQNLLNRKASKSYL